jgi:hypothetical protein
MTESKRKKQYINNGDFLKALEEYKEKKRYAAENDLPAPKIPNYIGECFLKIAEGLSRKPNFINYTFKEEMIADGYENCLMYFHNFDSSKSKNPFAYFTQVIWFAFLRRIDKEKEEMYVKYKMTERVGVLDEYELQELEELGGSAKPFEMYDNLSEFIEKFEEKKRKKKTTTKKAKGLDLFLGE